MLRKAVVGAALLAAAGPLSAQQADWTEVRARRQAADLQSLKLEVEYIAGELQVLQADAGLLYDTHLKYDASRMRPERSWSLDGGAANLHLGFEGLGDDGDLDLDVESDEHGFLRLGLSPDVPTDLRIAVGAAVSMVELGGIPVTGLVYKTGASDTEIRFGSPNPADMERMELAVGAAEFEAEGLGNARFRELSFKGAVGDVTLDFTGDWTRDATASIDMGLGSLTLVFPAELGVRITKKGFLASLDAPGYRKLDGGEWQSPGWDAAAHHLEIRLLSALGSIEVRQER